MTAASRLSPTIYKQHCDHLLAALGGISSEFSAWNAPVLGPHCITSITAPVTMCDADYATARASKAHGWAVCGFPAEIMCALLQYVEIMCALRDDSTNAVHAQYASSLVPCARLHAGLCCNQSYNSLSVYRVKAWDAMVWLSTWM